MFKGNEIFKIHRALALRKGRRSEASGRVRVVGNARPQVESEEREATPQAELK